MGRDNCAASFCVITLIAAPVSIRDSAAHLEGKGIFTVAYIGVRLCAAQALCFTHHVPARRVAPAAPVREHFGRCGILESSESWALYDALPMTRTDGSTHDSSDDRTMIIQQ